MRLVTRCPACATTFKVVRDQLRISEGWVRCGRCSEVFDATLDLLETDDDGVPLESPRSGAPAAAPVSHRLPQENLLPPAPSGLPAIDWPAANLLDLGARPAPAPATPAPPASPAPAPVRSPAPYDAAQDPVPIPSLEQDGDDEDEKEPWLDEMMASTQALQAALQSMPASLDVSSSSPPAAQPAPRQVPGFTPSLTSASPIEEAVNNQLQKALRRERIKALRRERAEQKERERAARHEPQTAPVGEPGATAGLASPVPPEMAETVLLEVPSAPASFTVDVDITQPETPSRARRLLWMLACLLAIAVLLAQVMRQERDTLVAREPRLRPVLQTLCDWTGCQLSALRQIGAISIDGASFSREKEGEGYRLVFSLRNGARVPLAMPSIELTLLDTQERALVRRVMSPSQFGANAVLAAGAEHNASLPLQLAGSEAVGLPPVAGYRLIAFYP